MSLSGRIAFHTKLIRVGLFRCYPWQPWFEDTGPIENYLIVFPRTSVRIIHAGRKPVIANPNVVMFYNQGQVYRRSKLSERGDLCEWFAFDSEAILDVVRPYDPWVQDRADRPFAFTHAPSDAGSYLLQRRVVEHILNSASPDHLYVEEAMMYVLGTVVANAYHARQGTQGNPTRRPNPSHKELVDAVQAVLASHFRKPISLAQIASAVHYSPYHLCRLFRRLTGFTIHHYLEQMRLRTALEYVTQDDTDLTDLALSLGFSSHSHFAQMFKRTFGVPPSNLRRTPVSHHLPKLRKNSIA